MNKLKPPKISPCPDCRSTDGPGILEGISTSCFKKHTFRVGCPCGCRGPRATTVRRAIEIWNDRSL